MAFKKREVMHWCLKLLKWTFKNLELTVVYFVFDVSLLIGVIDVFKYIFPGLRYLTCKNGALSRISQLSSIGVS